MNNKNLIFVGTSNTFYPVVDELIKEEQINLIHWFFKNPSFDKEIELALKENYTSRKDKAYFNVLDKLHFIFNTYIRMREAKGKSYYELINMFNILYDYVFYILSKKVDYIFFTNIPHNGVDLIVYYIAKELNIKTILFYNNPLFADRFFYIYDIEDFGIYNDIPKSSEKLEFIKLERNFKKDSVVKKGLKVEKRRQQCIIEFFSSIFKMCLNKRVHTSFSYLIESYFKCKIFKRHLNSAVTSVDFNKKFVYFALHLQPELHTSTLGGVYNDQILAIEKLSEILPNDFFIYVKEHPQQLFFQRDEYFFKRLKKLKNVKYLSSSVSTYELMLKAKFVSTITGTVAWEAVTGGKPSLIFGRAWFRKLHGVFEYNDNFNINEIIDFNVNHQFVEKEYNELILKSREGTTNADYISFVKDFSLTNNTNLLKKFIISQL